MSNEVRFPVFGPARAWFNDGGYPDKATVTTIVGNADRGEELVEKIHDKVVAWCTDIINDPTHIIIDAQSYIDIRAYFCINEHLANISNPTALYTQVGLLPYIVLPQKNNRLQITGDPMGTAVAFFIKERR